jgi:hypothetical protein
VIAVGFTTSFAVDQFLETAFTAIASGTAGGQRNHAK